MITKKDLDLYFVDKGWTVPQIAKHFKTYPNEVRRALIKYRFKPPSKSEAQIRALKQGRAKHPTEGTHRSEEVRKKISNGKKESNDRSSCD